MENTRSNSPSISTILDGIKAADIKVNYGPDLPSDPEVVEYFNKLRPDTWSIIPPEEKLNPQQREALAIFGNADNLREDPSYETIMATSRLLVGAEARRLRRQKYEYAESARETIPTLRYQVFNNDLDENSLFYEYLQLGASSLGRLAILECLGFSEASVRGAISCRSVNAYEIRKRASKKFFALTDEEREEKLEKLLKQSEYTIRRRRANREKRK